MSNTMRTLLAALAVSLAVSPATGAVTAETFGFDTMAAKPHPNRPLLMLCANFATTPMRTVGGVNFAAVTRPGLAKSREVYDRFVFNYLNLSPDPKFFGGRTINAAFLEMSAGSFVWTRAASFPVRNFNEQETRQLEESSEPFGDPPGRAYAIETTPGLNFIVGKFLADNPSFNLASFDTNNDRVITADELTVLLISNYAERGGANRYLNLTGLPNPSNPSQPLTFQGQLAWCDHHTSFSTWVHEISHSLNTTDLYIGNQVGSPSNSYGYLATLMGGTLDLNNDDNTDIWHLDPWHKMKLGWLRPRLVPMSKGGGFVLRCAQSPGTQGPILLYDDTKTEFEVAREFFMIEFRNPSPPSGPGYDANAAARGLVIWHIGTNANLNPYRLPDPTKPTKPKDENGPQSVIVEGRNATNNGFSLGGDNKTPARQYWTETFYASLPRLRGFNGGVANSVIKATKGYDGSHIFFELILGGETWVDFNYLGTPIIVENGSVNLPWNTLAEGYNAAKWGGTIRLKSGAKHETGTYTKAVTLTAENGPVTIGQP